MAQIAGGNKGEGAPSSANFGDFPSAIPTLKKRFASQDTTLNDEGYDSEGNLPYFADEEQDDIEGYEELPIGGDAAAPAPPPPQLSSSSRTHHRIDDASRTYEFTIDTSYPHRMGIRGIDGESICVLQAVL